MKKLFLGICYSLISQIVFSQTISGTVTDAETGKPIPAVSLLVNNQWRSQSNDEGVFRLVLRQSGTYRLRLSSVGYQPLDTLLSTNQPSIQLRLQPWKLLLQPVEVRAVRAGDNAPFTKTNIGKADIEQQNLGQDLPFLLNQTPAVVVNSDAGNGIGYTGIRIRGSDATRINMTINGIPYNDAESQGLFFVNLPDFASSVSNIQVQRGVGTSSNGAGAFGASINFSTNEANTSPYAELNNSAGSFNTWKHTLKLGSGLLGQHFTFDARLSGLNSDGYIDRASTDLSSFYLSGAYLTEKTSLRINFFSGKERTYQSWNGVAEAQLNSNRTFNSAGTERPGSPYENETDNYRQDHYQFFINHQASKTITLNTAFFLTKGKGYYEQYKAEQAYAKYGLPDFSQGAATSTETDLIRRLWLDNNYYGQILSLQYHAPGTQFTLGGGWNRYDGLHQGRVIWAAAGIPDDYHWYDHDSRKTDINGYMKIQQKLIGRFQGFADLQVRTVNYHLNGFRDNPALEYRQNWTFFNPKIGISYKAGPLFGYLSYSIGQKEPNRDDFEAGTNQLPKPEKMQDLELGFEQRTGNYRAALTLYYMRYKDQLVLTGKINDVGAYVRTNIPSSYRMGIEIQAGTRIGNKLRINGNLALSRNRVLDFTAYYDDYDNGGQQSVSYSKTAIAYSPEVVAGAELSFTPVPALELAFPAKYVSQQYLDNTGNAHRSLNAYFVQDARISWRITSKSCKEILLIGQLYNLFNKKYEPNGYTFSYQYGGDLITESYYFPMAGTNFMFGVNLRW